MSGTTASQPTVKQLRALRALAQATGTTFSPPRTRRQASNQIAAMSRRKRSSRKDIARERAALRNDLQNRSHDAVRVRGHETHGYGSTASWRPR